MADLNERPVTVRATRTSDGASWVSRVPIWGGEAPCWERVSDTTGWRPSLQLTVHIKGDKGAEARDRLMTLCAIYDGAELLRILPTVAEARLKLTPKAEPDPDDVKRLVRDAKVEQFIRDMGKTGAAIAALRDDLDTAKEEGDRQIRKLEAKLEALLRLVL